MNVQDYLQSKRNTQAKPKKIYSSFVLLDDGKLSEEIVNPDPVFIVYDPKTDKTEMRPTVQVNGKYVYPFEGDLVTKKVILFPQKVEEYQDLETLRLDIRQFIHKYVDIHPFYEDLASYYILLTWLFDKNTAITYLGIFGDYGTGKTRAAQTIGSLCYKPAFVSGAITCAPIYRLLEQARGTLIINEFDFKDSELGSELIKILNNGFEKNMHVLRANKDNGQVEAFDAFSPKIFTYRKKKSDLAFESRLVTIPIEETKREDIPIILPASFEAEAILLRNKLLLFRFRNYHKKIEADTSIFIGIERRLRQTLYPLLTVIDDTSFLKRLTVFINDLQTQQCTDRGLSWVAEYLQCLVTLLAKNEVITVNDLTEAVNINKEQKDKVTPRKVSNMVRSELKFKTERLTSGNKKGQAQIKIDYEKLKALCLRFGVDMPEQSSPRSPSSPRDQPQSEVSEDSERSTGTEILFPVTISNYSFPTKEELINKEKELRNAMQGLNQNSPEYEKIYHPWFAIRDKGVEMGIFPYFAVSNEE